MAAGNVLGGGTTFKKPKAAKGLGEELRAQTEEKGRARTAAATTAFQETLNLGEFLSVARAQPGQEFAEEQELLKKRSRQIQRTATRPGRRSTILTGRRRTGIA